MTYTNRKMLSILITLALIAAVTISVNPPNFKQARTTTPTVTITGEDGTAKTFTLTELETMSDFAGFGDSTKTTKKQSTAVYGQEFHCFTSLTR